MVSTKNLVGLVIAVSCVGLCVCSYAYHVEYAIHHEKGYKALCDINAWISCSKVFSSKYGRGFGIIGSYLGDNHILNQPNSVYGLTFYTLQILCGIFYRHKVVATVALVLALLSNSMCFYLAYILFVLRDICVVCIFTYILNFIILLSNVTLFMRRKQTVPLREHSAPVSKRRSKKDK